MPQIVGEIHITQDEKGNLAVKCGARSQVEAFGMLTMAAHILRDTWAKNEAGPKLEIPQFLPPDDVLRGPGSTPG